MLQGRPHRRSTSASDLACTRHGKPSQVAHRMHALKAGSASSSMMPHGAWKGCSPTGHHVVEQPLDARLVRDRREGVRRRCRRLGGVLAASAVHLVQLFGLGVVRLQHVVVDRPRRRDPAVVLELAEVALSQPVQGSAVELGRSAHEVVDLGLERLAVLVVPRVRGDVPVVDEDRLGVPVLHLARQPVAALQDQDPLPGRCEPVCEGAAARSRTHDDDVVLVGHDCLLRSVAPGSAVASSTTMCGTSCSSSPQAMRCGVRRGLDGGGVVAVEVVPGPGQECVGLAVRAAQQHRVYAEPGGEGDRALDLVVDACRPRRRRRCGRSSP